MNELDNAMDDINLGVHEVEKEPESNGSITSEAQSNAVDKNKYPLPSVPIVEGDGPVFIDDSDGRHSYD